MMNTVRPLTPIDRPCLIATPGHRGGATLLPCDRVDDPPMLPAVLRADYKQARLALPLLGNKNSSEYRSR